MKIEQSAVAMTAGHSFSSEYEMKVESTSSFRTLFDGAAQASELSAVSEEDRQRQLLLVLESLIARMLEFITGNRSSRVSDLREALPKESSTPQAPRARQTEIEWTTETTESIREQERTAFASTGKVRRRMDERLISRSISPCAATSRANARPSPSRRRCCATRW